LLKETIDTDVATLESWQGHGKPESLKTFARHDEKIII
jgi:hypothetical protein